MLRVLLSAERYRVIEADTGQRAAVEARSHKPDLLVVDLGLPDRDGLELIRSVRGWSPVPIIVLSARTNEADKIAALDAGADDYVTKPFWRPRTARESSRGFATHGNRCGPDGADHAR